MPVQMEKLSFLFQIFILVLMFFIMSLVIGSISNNLPFSSIDIIKDKIYALIHEALNLNPRDLELVIMDYAYDPVEYILDSSKHGNLNWFNDFIQFHRVIPAIKAMISVNRWAIELAIRHSDSFATVITSAINKLMDQNVNWIWFMGVERALKSQELFSDTFLDGWINDGRRVAIKECFKQLLVFDNEKNIKRIMAKSDPFLGVILRLLHDTKKLNIHPWERLKSFHGRGGGNQFWNSKLIFSTQTPKEFEMEWKKREAEWIQILANRHLVSSLSNKVLEIAKEFHKLRIMTLLNKQHYKREEEGNMKI